MATPTMTVEEIYRWTHPDFRGHVNGRPAVLVGGSRRGTTLCPIEALTEEERWWAESCAARRRELHTVRAGR